MKGVSRIPLIIIIGLFVVIALLAVWINLQSRVAGAASFHESAISLQIVSEASEGDIECEGINIRVLQKEGIVKEGNKIMNNCIIALVNCGPGSVTVDDYTAEWEIDHDKISASESTQIYRGVINPGKVNFVACNEIFDGKTINIDTNKFVIEDIPITMRLTGPKGEASDSWNFDYITKEGVT